VLGVLSLALHRDLLPRLGSAVPNDLGDPLLNTWILWWNAHAVPFTAAYWNAPAFAPAPYVLALSETLLGVAWLTSPLQWLGAPPIVAYNVLVLVTPVLNGLSMYWLCLTLTGRRDAAAVGGLAYAFAPYHASQVSHVQTQAMFWMPVALAALHRYWSTGERRWLAWLAAATALNGLTCGYFLLYFAVLLGLAIVWLTMASGSARKLAEVAAALAAAALALAPVIVTYRGVRAAWNLQRPFYEIEGFGADLLLLAAGDYRLWLWPFRSADWPLPGQAYPQYPGIAIAVLLLVAAVVAVRQRATRTRSRWRGRLVVALIGIAALQLAAAGVYAVIGPWALTFGPVGARVSRPWPLLGMALQLFLAAALVSPRFTALVRAGSIPGLYGTGAVLTTLLALGPRVRIAGEPVWNAPPFAWLMRLPGFDATRVPALFGAIAVLCLAVLAAFAVVRLVPRHTKTSGALFAVLALAIVADGWIVLRVVNVPPPIQVPLTGDLVVELPRHDHFDDVAAMYRGMAHGRPVVNGYSGYVPPHWGHLIFDLAVPCFESLAAVRRGRSLDVVIWVGTDEARRIDAAFLDRWGGAVREEFAGTIVYHLPRDPGTPPVGTVDHDIDLRDYCLETRPR
jgi:hypothetical protein